MKITNADDLFAVAGQADLTPVSVCLKGFYNVALPGETITVKLDGIKPSKLVAVRVDGKTIKHDGYSFEFKCSSKKEPGVISVEADYEKDMGPDKKLITNKYSELLRVADKANAMVFEFYAGSPTCDEAADMALLMDAMEFHGKVKNGEITMPSIISMEPIDDVLIDEDDADAKTEIDSLREAIDYVNSAVSEKLADINRFRPYVDMRSMQMAQTLHALITMAKTEDGKRMFDHSHLPKLTSLFDNAVLANMGNALWAITNPTTVDIEIKNLPTNLASTT